MSIFKHIFISTFLFTSMIFAQNTLSIENVELPSDVCEDVADINGQTCDTIINVFGFTCDSAFAGTELSDACAATCDTCDFETIKADIVMTNDFPVAGFEFSLSGVTITQFSAGTSDLDSWTISGNAVKVLGFSSQGATIAPGTSTLVKVGFVLNQGETEVCITEDGLTMSDSAGIAQPFQADDFGNLDCEALSSTVNVQIIHNSASPTVDVWVDGTVAIAGVAYRTATAVLELPKMFSVAISAAGDTDVLYTQDFDLEAGKSYVVVASGLLGDLTTPFILNATETTFGATDGNVGLEVYHGSTDAPPVDILANGTVLIPNLAYGQFSGYSPVAAADYQIGIAPAGGAAIAVFDASLSGLGGGSAVVFASGFLSPAADQPAFSVLAALANGTVLELPSLEADCAGIWGGGAVEDCAGVCNGSAVEDACGECGGEAIDNSTCGQYYNVMLDDTGVSALVVFQAVITTLDVGDEIGVFDMQGLVNNGCGDDAQYGEILVGSGVWTGEQLNMTLIGSVSDPCDFGGTALPGYRGGNALEIRVMHKINSDTDLYPYEYKVDPTYVIGDGTFPTSSSSFNIISELDLGEVLDNEDVSILPNDFTLSQNYPNPFNPVTDINFSVGVSGEISIEVYDIIGNHITTLSDGFASPGNYKVSWDGTDKNGTNVSSGVYIYTLITPNQTISKRMLLIK